MTRTDDFVQQLERYLDEYDGMTPLPVDVRDAVRAALPSTKQTRPTRGLMRYLHVKRPTAVSYGLVAVAVAVVAVVALGASALLNNQVVGPAPSASALADCTEGISASGETLTVGWCPTRPGGQQVRVSFRLTTTAAAWTNGNQFMFEDMIFFRPYGAGMQPGGSVGISVGGPATVDAWLAQIIGEQTYTVTEPHPISLGGAEGYVFDVSVAPGFTSFYAPPLFDNSARPWELSNDLIDRVWLVEHAGQSVMFVTTPVGPRDNPVSSDQSWAREIGDALQTIEWIP